MPLDYSVDPWAGSTNGAMLANARSIDWVQ